MKIFSFLAKQGQHNQVARLLTDEYGTKPKLQPYKGSRGEGVLITMPLTGNRSKRSVDRFLKANNVPGAVSRRNRFRIIRVEHPWEIGYRHDLDVNETFILSLKGQRKLQKATLKYHNFGCTCCGGYYYLEDQQGNRIE